MSQEYRVSASRTELLLVCQWWARPEHELGQEPVNIAAQNGKRTHKVVENYFNGKEIKGARWDDVRLVKFLMDKLGSKWVESERAMVVDPRNSTVRLVTGADRDYGDVGETEIPGTADLIWLDDDNTLHVSDVKTGNPRHLQTVGESAQLHTLALGFSLAFNRPVVRVSYIITFGGEPKMLGPVELDETDLTLHRLALADALENIPRSLPVLNKDCWKCRAKRICPAYTRKKDG